MHARHYEENGVRARTALAPCYHRWILGGILVLAQELQVSNLGLDVQLDVV